MTTGGVTIDYPEHVRADAARLGEVLAGGNLDADVPTCPGWTLRDLAHHLGGVHRWARIAAAHGRRPERGEVEGPPPDAGLVGWLVGGAGDLADTLATVEIGAPTWHPFPTPLVGAVWPRRQAHETVVHRWDAETVTGEHTPIDPVLAADGIAEYFELIVPRVVSRDGVDAPDPMVIELTDAGLVLEVSAGDAGAGTGTPDVSGRAAECSSPCGAASRRRRRRRWAAAGSASAGTDP